MDLPSTSLCFLLIYLLVPSPIGANCPSNFIKLDNKCYYFSVTRETWRDAHFICKDLGSHLITIRNKQFDYKLQNYLWNGYLGPSEWWIGANYDWKQKLWRWGTSGRVVKYQNMIVSDKHLEWHCAYLDRHLNYKWNAALCTQRKNFICQRKLEANGTATPETANNNNEIPLITSPFSGDSSYYRRNTTTNLIDHQPAFINKPRIKQGTSRTRLICPHGYRHVKGACYRFSKRTATWQNAYYECDADYNGTLAIIPDKSHDRALRRSLKRLAGDAGVQDRWIGGIYDWKEMAWKWARNGVIIQHQTVDQDLLRWHCLVWSPNISDKWTSDNCVKEKHYLCQTKGTRIMFPGEMRMHQQPLTKNKRTKWDYEIEVDFAHSKPDDAKYVY